MKNEEKKKIQIYVYPNLYAKLRSILALKRHTVTSWFEEKAKEEVKNK